MSTAGTETSDGSRKPVVNFSRPRLGSKGQADKPDTPPTPTPNNGAVKSVSAFHDSSDGGIPFPSEPRFSTDSETLSNTSANARRGDTYTRTAPIGGLHAQRHPGTVRLPSTSTTSTVTNGSSTLSRPSTTDSVKQLMPKSILKQTSVEVSSERASSDAGESTGSHHTVSESGDSSMVGYEKDGKWSSSDYDTSGMSEKEVRKLERKGKNPALVAEIQAARRGKGIVGVMAGTSYVS